MHRPLPRLPEEDYIGRRTVAFTACLKGRSTYFVDLDSIGPHVSILESVVTDYRAAVPIYCFMPDHLHVLLMGLEDDSNLIQAFRKFKLKSGIALQRYTEVRWQHRFYDHVVRVSEDWRHQSTYIAMNPVRAGLVEDCFDYPLLGTIGCDLQDVILRF